jgi:hypothetical protein
LDFIGNFTIGLNEVNHQKCGEFNIPQNAIKVKFKEELERFNYKNDVIFDANEVICNKNLKIVRRYWAFLAILAHSAMVALEVWKLKIGKLRKFFGDFGKFGDIVLAISPLHYTIKFTPTQEPWKHPIKSISFLIFNICLSSLKETMNCSLAVISQIFAFYGHKLHEFISPIHTFVNIPALIRKRSVFLSSGPGY